MAVPGLEMLNSSLLVTTLGIRKVSNLALLLLLRLQTGAATENCNKFRLTNSSFTSPGKWTEGHGHCSCAL